jgi:hypothetical protein
VQISSTTTFRALIATTGFLLRILAPAAGLLPCGCLFTTHSFNHGRLLNPGETMISLGAGERLLHDVRTEFEYEYLYDTITFEESYVPVDTFYDTLSARLLTTSLDYRLGILRTIPFGRGLEYGFHFELPLIMKKGVVYGSEIPVLEFGLRAGLSSFPLRRGLFHHNIEAGWSIGQWVDNGWYGGYAASWERGRIMPYLGARFILGPSSPLEQGLSAELSEGFFDYHDRTFLARVSAGTSITLPRLPVLPDILCPEVSVIFPNYTNLHPVGFGVQAGLRWLNGI